MTPSKILAVVVLAGAVLAAPLSAQNAQWKLPTIVPTGSPWHNALKDMTAKWSKDTSNHLATTIYPNGALGGEPAIVRAMRSGQYQASLLMLSGAAVIDDGFNALGIPFFFQNDAETKAVQEALTPLIEKRIATQGFHLVAWTNGGWVQLFSTKEMKTLDDIKHVRLWTSDGDTRMVQWYKTNGFNPQPMDANAMAGALTMGTIDATPSPAYPALLMNMQTKAKYMLDIHVGPLLGALVVTTTAWNAMSADDQAKLTAAAKIFEQTTSAAIPAQDADAVAQMQKKGLVMTKMTPSDQTALYAQIEKLGASMRGNMVPADLYDKAKEARDAYRAKAKAPAKH